MTPHPSPATASASEAVAHLTPERWAAACRAADPESPGRVLPRAAADSRAALGFFVELRSTLGLSAEILPVYLEEISSTLAGTAYKLTKEPTTSAQLAVAVSRPSKRA